VDICLSITVSWKSTGLWLQRDILKTVRFGDWFSLSL